MITVMSDMPTGVVGFEVRGTVRAEDYRDVVIPALERAAATGEVRFVTVIPEFQGMTGGALAQDLKVAAQYLRNVKRIAVVTDIEWMRHAVDLFGWMTPPEMEVFPLARRAEAIAWVMG
jgi:hypothetical protein